MGIPSFFVHAVRTYKRIVKPITSLGVPVSNLYLDCNGLIYNAVRDVKLPGTQSENRTAYEYAIIQHVCNSISAYIATVAPTTSVFIAFDGVAPAAKLNQQRERRFKTWLATVVDADIQSQAFSTPASAAASASASSTSTSTLERHTKLTSSEVWSTACITPGTEFMGRLHTEMVKYRNQQSELMPSVKFILSTSVEPGEGEHKIFEHIRDHPEAHRDQVTLVYGLDADLIMLTLNHLHISNRIFLYRETPEFIRSVDSSLRPNEQYYVDIPFMADCIAEHITVSPSVDTTQSSDLNSVTVTRKHLVYDYIFMFFMMGNDFMPHFPSMNIRTTGPATIMDAYRTVFKNTLSHSDHSQSRRNQSFIHYETDTDNNGSKNINTRPRINWTTVKQFIEYLASSEQDRFIDEHNLRSKKSGRGNDGYEYVSDPSRPWGDNYTSVYELIINKCESNDATLHLPSKERGVEFYIAPSKPDWERRYYHVLFDQPITDKRCKTYCMNYLEGLEWTFSYYTYGCIDWKWKYNYMYPPLLQDLVRFIPSSTTTSTSTPTTTTTKTKTTAKINSIESPFLLESRPKEPITSLEQLQYVLPPALQRALLPGNMHASGNDTDDQVKRGLKIKWAYCKYFWEAHLHYGYGP
jgi:5'-3' exonuclease